ncbi:hypothetical protein QE152_g29920 [Popillia japonica]|uniref:Uncharacterized protein n=1 Tax=Popillia japonica TaxID=7064 RepID=A0AAW1JG52_POPJA
MSIEKSNQPMATTSQPETIIRSENDVPARPPPLLEITSDSPPAATTAENVPTSTTSIVSLPQNNHNISFEELLLSTIRQTPTVGVKQKKTRVCFGSEVLTTNDVLQGLKEKTNQSEEFWNDLEEELAPESSTDSVIGLGKWILVKYCTKKYVKHYIGQIIEKIDLEWKVKFTKFANKKFFWPDIDAVDIIPEEDIVKILPDPVINRRGGGLTFTVQFQGYNL